MLTPEASVTDLGYVPLLTTMSHLSGHASASSIALAMVATGVSWVTPSFRSLPPSGGVETKISPSSIPLQFGSGTSSEQPSPVVVVVVVVVSLSLSLVVVVVVASVVVVVVVASVEVTASVVDTCVVESSAVPLPSVGTVVVGTPSVVVSVGVIVAPTVAVEVLLPSVAEVEVMVPSSPQAKRSRRVAGSKRGVMRMTGRVNPPRLAVQRGHRAVRPLGLVSARPVLHTPAVPGPDAARAAAILADLGPLLPGLASPALVVDLAAVDHNIAAVLRRCRGDRPDDPGRGADRWRPHVKTLKSAALVRRLWAAGVTRCKCATLDELQLLLEAAAEDAREDSLNVLLAYPLHEAAFHAARRLHAAHPAARVQLLADGPEHALAMDRWARGGAGPIDLQLERQSRHGPHRQSPVRLARRRRRPCDAVTSPRHRPPRLRGSPRLEPDPRGRRGLRRPVRLG
ncbi:hypothetical protein [Nannocystis pusilla]|uniref:hypothetical protein n=1 Tax=Nannocystis pusilla TaxID=889268 RepID=UPI003DA1CE4E